MLFSLMKTQKAKPHLTWQLEEDMSSEFTRQFLLMRKWGLVMRLVQCVLWCELSLLLSMADLDYFVSERLRSE